MAKIRPYKSDGCSLFQGMTEAHNNVWLHCCDQHDRAYWRGGTYAQRCAADAALMECVAKTGNAAIAAVMLTAVRAGGSPYLPTQFRWGYGWPYWMLRGYKANAL